MGGRPDASPPASVGGISRSLGLLARIACFLNLRSGECLYLLGSVETCSVQGLISAQPLLSLLGSQCIGCPAAEGHGPLEGRSKLEVVPISASNKTKHPVVWPIHQSPCFIV